MDKEVISKQQAISLVVFFIMGSALILPTAAVSGRDAWVATILAIIFSAPILAVYARIKRLFPDKDLFDVSEFVFGKIIGKFIIILYTWFCFHLGTFVLVDLGEYMSIVALGATPRILLILFMAILCAWGVKAGIEVLGRWSQVILPLVIIFFVIVPSILLITEWDINNILPTFYLGFKPILQGAFSVFAFPFAETIMFTMTFCTLKKNTSPYSVYLSGLLIGGTIILIDTLVVTLTLGAEHYGHTFFTSHSAFSRIHLTDFLQRLEILPAASFLTGVFVKTSICLYAASRGLAKIFGLRNYRFIVIPITLLMVNLSDFIYKNIMDLTSWLNIWPFYAFPFQVLLPIVILIGAEIKVRMLKKA